jgi:two-component system, NarL family, sensor histidine kinase UhpB
MSKSRPELPGPPERELSRDLIVVLGGTALSVVLSAHYNLNEALFALTRRGERLQLDELPIGGVVLLIGLIWLSWRRYRQVYRELRARRITEARLAGVVAENRRLAQENLRIQELERKHLARELHDEFGQYLHAIKLDAVSMIESGVGSAEGGDAAEGIIRSVDHIDRALHNMIARLRPVALDELGLAAAIEHLVDQWRQRLPDVRIDLALQGDFEGLGEAQNLSVYRLIQEGLTNVYKHARARHVRVVLEQTPPGDGRADEMDVRLVVADDGCGMQAAGRIEGFGLSGMRERVEAAGGTFMVKSAPGAGLVVEARLPGRRKRDD